MRPLRRLQIALFLVSLAGGSVALNATTPRDVDGTRSVTVANGTLDDGDPRAMKALEQLRALAHGYRIIVAITRGAPAPGIDTPADLERARESLARPRARSVRARNPL